MIVINRYLPNLNDLRKIYSWFQLINLIEINLIVPDMMQVSRLIDLQN
jgi:hypothetical protein